MQYRQYGKTGKAVSVIGIGAMRFPPPTSRRDVEKAARTLLRAYEQGVNYFDTAPLYCGDRSEEIVACALREMKPGTYYVSTKSSHAEGSRLREQLERSRDRLGVERIHFFHIWCVLRPEEWKERRIKGALEAAWRAKEEGLIEHVAWSTHMSGQEIAEVLREGVVEGMTLGYNALNFPFRQVALRAAREAGIGVVCMNPLAGGLIPRHARRFDFIRRPEDPDVVTAALRFVLSEPAVTCALVGASSPEEVDAAVRAVREFRPYAEMELAELKNKIEASFQELCTGCQYCLPCPAGVPIPQLMDAMNFWILNRHAGEVRDRLKWHWDLSPEAASDCTECGLCEERCTQRLPIRRRLQELTRLSRAWFA